MEYFWMQQDDIPPEMGYPLFGAAHLISVAVTLSLVAIALIVLRKKSGRVQRVALKAIPLVMLVLEVAKDLFLLSIHKFGLGYLPLHVCSIGNSSIHGGILAVQHHADAVAIADNLEATAILEFDSFAREFRFQIDRILASRSRDPVAIDADSYRSLPLDYSLVALVFVATLREILDGIYDFEPRLVNVRDLGDFVATGREKERNRNKGKLFHGSVLEIKHYSSCTQRTE